MVEIFSYDLTFSADEEAEGVYIISGKNWEGEPFKLYLREDDANNLMWQIPFYISKMV